MAVNLCQQQQHVMGRWRSLARKGGWEGTSKRGGREGLPVPGPWNCGAERVLIGQAADRSLGRWRYVPLPVASWILARWDLGFWRLLVTAQSVTELSEVCGQDAAKPWPSPKRVFKPSKPTRPSRTGAEPPPQDSWDTIRGADTYPYLGLEGTPKVVLVGGGPARLKQLARANSD